MAFMPGKHIVFIDNLPSESFKYTSQEFKNKKLDFF